MITSEIAFIKRNVLPTSIDKMQSCFYYVESRENFISLKKQQFWVKEKKSEMGVHLVCFKWKKNWDF